MYKRDIIGQAAETTGYQDTQVKNSLARDTTLAEKHILTACFQISLHTLHYIYKHRGLCLIHAIFFTSIHSAAVELLDPARVRYKFWPKAKEKIHSERSLRVLQQFWITSWKENEPKTKEDTSPQAQQRRTYLSVVFFWGRSCCDFFQCTGQAAGAAQKGLWSFAKMSYHLKTQKNNGKTLGKNDQRNRGSLDWGKKKHGVLAACFVSYSLLIPALLLLSSTTLPFLLNQSLAESSTDSANLFYTWHFQDELSN